MNPVLTKQLTVSFLVLAILLTLTASVTFAQCPPLINGTCIDTTGVPVDFSFTVYSGAWTVIGVLPTAPDDKDILIYPSCASGTPLAGSTETNGTDFVVGDFNLNPVGTFYARTDYAGLGSSYTVLWLEGGAVLPISSFISADMNTSPGPDCNMMAIFDAWLKAGVEYRIRFHYTGVDEAYVSLFRNAFNSTSFWADRGVSEWELPASDGDIVYVPPQTDWYGLVIFPEWKLSGTETYGLEVEKLHDCSPLPPDTCVSEYLYSPVTGPGNDFHFVQDVDSWSVVTVTCEPGDNKGMGMYTECDGDGTYLTASSSANPGETELIVGDFNHNTLGDYFVRVNGGTPTIPFTIEHQPGGDVFPIPAETDGYLGGSECTQARVWNVHLESGMEYEFLLYEWGDAEPHLALFRNSGAWEFWGGRWAAEFEMNGSGFQSYTAPKDDWYGLVVFANARGGSESLYQIQVQELGDCPPLTSGECVTTSAWPRDFSYQHIAPFWSVIGILPSPGDLKGISVFTQCDAKGTLLANTSGYEANFVVGDFNHNALGTYYATVTLNSPTADYTIQYDMGSSPADMFPVGSLVTGSIGGTTGQCEMVKIWDVYLEAGAGYNVGFTKDGTADVRLGLFHNPSATAYWAARGDGEWDVSATGNFTYFAPATDWYGLVAYANVRDGAGTYSINITPTSPPTAIDPEPPVPDRFALHQNAPNPFNPTTTIRYDVPANGGRVSLKIYDVNGRLVRTLADAAQTPGEKSVVWNGKDNEGMQVSSGVYFCRLVTPGLAETRKMILMR